MAKKGFSDFVSSKTTVRSGTSLDFCYCISGVGIEFENCFVVYSCSCSTFILYVSVNSGIGFYLVLGSFLTFWGPNGLLGG